jgi:hypothetical protein
MRRMAMFLLVAAVGTAGLSLGGCGLFEPTQTGVLVKGDTSTIEDVPVPSGFKYTDEQSSSTVDPEKKSREAVQNFYGKAALLRIAEFYKDKLPETKWTGITVNQLPKKVTITATKGNNDLVIEAWDDMFYTKINIRLILKKK